MDNTENTLTNYITTSHSAWTLERNRDGKPYNDNLCFFRAVAAFLLNTRNNLASKTYELFQQFIQATQMDEASFDGTFLPEIPFLDELFGLLFLIYTSELNNTSQVVGSVVYKHDTCVSSSEV